MNRKIFIFDLDGTLIDSYHRQRHLRDETMSWDERFDTYHSEIETDKPILHSMAICNALYQAGHDILFLTARSACQRAGTVSMLSQYLTMTPEEISDSMVMRPEGDRRPDQEIKSEMFDALSEEDRARVYGVFEDLEHLVQMWRDKGLYCYQVVHTPIPHN